MLQRVHLDIQVGEHTNNYPEIAAKDKLTELQLRVRQLLDQVEQIQKEQNYQRVSKKQNKKTNSSVSCQYWSWSHCSDLNVLVVFCSIVRSAFAWRVRAPTSVFSGGPSLRRSSSSSLVFGRWSTWRASLRPRNWCNVSVNRIRKWHEQTDFAHPNKKV